MKRLATVLLALCALALFADSANAWGRRVYTSGYYTPYYSSYYGMPYTGYVYPDGGTVTYYSPSTTYYPTTTYYPSYYYPTTTYYPSYYYGYPYRGIYIR